MGEINNILHLSLTLMIEGSALNVLKIGGLGFGTVYSPSEMAAAAAAA